ncbi:TRAP transporter small permease [Pararhodospirillum oryzae]|uniref:TRAP transporter small permease protein n=1 Tax=Pararhodospirillum oryzae TaxID=478448 RepID=A0A512HB33_9PROT|nr:TRAP transporter small permease subunit [Pararhodospirillum oryzae]GEO82648.1 hypothetical protein ROR02_27790 [Pararhodospirillum oryzae]
MSALGAFVDRLALWMFRLAGVMLLIMGGAVLVDVTGRALFRLTSGKVDILFAGGPELVAYSLLFTIVLGLPHALDRGQVAVDLITGRLGAVTRTRLMAFYYAGFAVLGAGLAVRLGSGAWAAQATGETTQTFQVPMALVLGPTAFACAVLALRGLVVAGRTWAEARALAR